MKDTEKGEFMLIMQGLASNYGKTLDSGALLMLWLGLRDLTISQFRQAAEKTIQTEEFMPTVKTLRDLAIGKPNAHLAWDAVNRAIDRYGGSASVDFEDKAINAAIRGMGGWDAICEMPRDEFDRFAFHRFEKAYSVWSSRGVTVDSGARLVGRHERRNVGYTPDDYPGAYIGQPVEIAADYALPKIEGLSSDVAKLADQKRITDNPLVTGETLCER